MFHTAQDDCSLQAIYLLSFWRRAGTYKQKENITQRNCHRMFRGHLVLLLLASVDIKLLRPRMKMYMGNIVGST